ncbi:hypothetical protein DM860_010309 [Cuscuta australis]|uniref:BHLH domain-containing protein n=1 Tax=Cuscuta australis TaxID=267555 RepID=A0A328D717_9ASTE|nr:hypothetical protein DM860_010309 [Cuscuta australis]
MSNHFSSADMQNLKHPFPILHHHHTDPTAMEIMNHFHDYLFTPNYPSEFPPHFNFHNTSSSSSMGLLFCPENFLPPELPPNPSPDFPANLSRTATGANGNAIGTAANLKIADGTPESCLTNSSPVSAKRTNSGGRRKRKKNGEEDEDEEEEGRVEEEEEKKKKPIREVVHVRAKRGQATDSHSLAERIRREKINERLRCLQEIVPGCYKTMGMAVMLDEIINYVQSLQNQVEFLSLKLAAASTYYDFNSDRDNIGTMQRAKTAYEGLKMEKQMKEGCEGGLSISNQSFLLDHNFPTPYPPSMPHST